MKHNVHCQDCKAIFPKLLAAIFGEIKRGYNIGISCRIEDYKNNIYFGHLEIIYKKLQNYRHYREFVLRKKLANVDFFAIESGIIIEFDEPQHFTELRKIALSNYPDYLDIGFDKSKWQSLCTKLNREDNNPVYRDEQRAWYDTLRDFAPNILNLKPTIRLYAGDFAWCTLNLNNKSDVTILEQIIGRKD